MQCGVLYIIFLCYHELDGVSLRAALFTQFQMSKLDADFRNLHLQGSTGALFQAILWSHGYMLAGRRQLLQQGKRVYVLLTPIPRSVSSGSSLHGIITGKRS